MVLDEPWDRGVGRPKTLSLAEAVAVACAYARQNITEEVLGEWWDVSQETISRAITTLTPLIRSATAEFVPTEEDAVEAVRGRACLVDGSITPCWSWRGHRELWSRKHGTTGHNTLVVADLSGNVEYVSDPLPGCTHDSTALDLTPVGRILAHSGGAIADKGFQGTGCFTPVKKPKGGELSRMQNECNKQLSQLRAPIERIMAHIKSWRILHTDYRRPLDSYYTSFKAAIGLFFFKMCFE